LVLGVINVSVRDSGLGDVTAGITHEGTVRRRIVVPGDWQAAFGDR